MKLFVYTLGCRVNQCESESISKAFSDEGFDIVRTYQDADLVVVNTCTVTSKAEQKARRVIRIYQEKAPTLVTGCYAQVNASEVKTLGNNVFVIPLTRKQDILKLPKIIKDNQGVSLCEILNQFCNSQSLGGTVFDYAATGFEYHCRSYLKIQDGCDNNCAFCRVHIARGKSVFLDSDEVVRRALEIEKNGYHEIVLTGVNLNMYDHNGEGLAGLLKKLLSALGPDMRIRLSSLEPDNITDALVDCLSDYRMQPYFHIPIQSASDKVIKRINRHYDNSHLEHVIERIRQIKDDPFLACDVITGLPGEEEEDFEITKNFLTEHGFALMHVFPFSPRPDTALYKAKDKVPESIRDERAKVLRDLSDSLNKEYVKRQIGKENEVILEEKKGNDWYGLTGNYIKVKVNQVPSGLKCGDLLKVVLISDNEAKAL